MRWGVLGFLLVQANICWAISLSGRLYTDIYNPIYPEYSRRITQASELLWLDLNTDKKARWQFHATGFFLAIPTSNIPDLATNRSSALLHEGYLKYSYKGFNLLAGKKMIRWGKADTINPTDLHTGTDQTILSSEPEINRLAGTSIMVTWRPTITKLRCRKRNSARKCLSIARSERSSSWFFEGVLTPIIPNTKLLTGFSALPEDVRTLPVRQPTITWGNSEYALKIGYSGIGWDFSVLGFQGWNHRPFYGIPETVVESTGPVLQLTPHYRRQRAFGFDFSTTLGRTVINGEAVWILTNNTNAKSALYPPPRLEAVLGLEYELFENFHMILQGIHSYYPALKSPTLESDPILVEIAKANAMIGRFQQAKQFGNSLRFIYDDPEQSHKFELFYTKFYEASDGYFQSKWTYKWTDSVDTSLGVDFYLGKPETPLGSLKNLSSSFFQLRYLF